MTEKMNLNMEDLEMVNGGTRDEIDLLNFTLMLKRYDNYVAVPADLDKMQKLFASKGYIFIPLEDEANIIFDPNGKLYSTEEFVQIICRDFKS